VRRFSPDISCPLGAEPSSPFKPSQFRIFSGLLLQLHLGQNRSPRGKGWTTQLLKEVTALRVHFSLSQRKMQVSAALFFLLVATATRAEWTTISTRTEPAAAAGLEHRHVFLEESETGDRAIVDLAIFSTRSGALRVIDNPGGDKNLAEAMEQGKCLAGVNGGYFDPNFTPIGLRIIDGKTLAPLLRARLLTGILTSSSRGIQIVRLSEFSRKEKLDGAIECGPMIVDLGAKVRGLDDTRLARRSFAAIDRDERAALGFCSEATLSGLARILAGQFVADFKIQRALNLDGGSSSAFWFKRKDGSVFSISEQKIVRDFVAVTPR